MNTKEPQNQIQIDRYYQDGPFEIGTWTSHIARSDPRHLAFILSRYKFCAKMLEGKEKVLEVGCGDGFGLPIVMQTVGSVTGIDFEPLVIDDDRKRFQRERIERAVFLVHDICEGSLPNKFDAMYSLDVIEHIPSEKEIAFLKNISFSLKSHGLCIIDTPNITAEKYASEGSRQGHINLKSVKTLKDLMSWYFYNVFSFSMNDEVVHTGYSPMAHYIICMGVGVREI